MAEGKIFIATEDFQPAGYYTTFRKDVTRVREGHPLLEQFPHLFREAEAHYEWPDVEQTTANPGEKRGAKQHA
jgi:hypothetical protein